MGIYWPLVDNKAGFVSGRSRSLERQRPMGKGADVVEESLSDELMHRITFWSHDKSFGR